MNNGNVAKNINKYYTIGWGGVTVERVVRLRDNKMKVFLGGTCNDSNWRNNLISLLKIDYFNPVVDDWTPDCMAEEIKQRNECDFCLYVITPKMTGVYSIAEVVDDSNKRPQKTIFCILPTDDGLSFTDGQLRSLNQVGKMIKSNGGHWFGDLLTVAEFLNSAK